MGTVDGKLAGKVAFITGVARGMGRSHAVRLAGEGADIIGLDLVEQVASVTYPMATPADLDETVRLVEEAGGRIVVTTGDVRKPGDVDAALAAGLAAFGRVDIVIANAGIASFCPSWQMSEQMWQDMIDINLTGVFHTVKSAIPSMIEAGRGGSIFLISSVAGIKGIRNLIHYSSAKHGLVGMMQGLCNELAEYNIRGRADSMVEDLSGGNQQRALLALLPDTVRLSRWCHLPTPACCRTAMRPRPVPRSIRIKK